MGNAAASGRVSVRDLTHEDLPILGELLRERWGSGSVASHGRLIDATTGPGFIAEADGAWVGYCAFEPVEHDCQLVAIESLQPGTGVGSALLARLARWCLEHDMVRLWLVTTNDNTEALRWYQRRGFTLAGVRFGAVTTARRKLKPEIPLYGCDGIEIRDELELELSPERWAETRAAPGLDDEPPR